MPPSCSRPIITSGASQGFRSALRISSTKVQARGDDRVRTGDMRWNLADLCRRRRGGRARWAALVERRRRSPSATAGRSPRSTPGLRALLDEADELEQELSRLQVYTYLRLSMDATDVEANDLATIGRDRAGDVENTWSSSASSGSRSTTTAPSSCSRGELAPYAHKLRVERMRSRTSSASPRSRRSTRAAHRRPRGRRCTIARCRRSRCRRRGEGNRPHTVSELLSYLYRNDREIRLAALEALFAASRRGPTCSRPVTTRSSAIGSPSIACVDSRIRCSRRT